MSGAWEIKAANQVMGAILHTDNVTLAWSFGLRNLIMPGIFHGFTGMPYDHARNEACKAFLGSMASHLFFLDSDVIPPRDAVLRLLSHNLPVVSGVYFRRSPPEGVPVMMKHGGWVTSLPTQGLMEVDLVGAGCLLIHRSVLENLPPQRPGKPWFDWRVDMHGLLPRHECLSEDFTFNTMCRKHGIATMVDCSIRCRHVGLAEAEYASFRPLSTTPHT